MFRITLTKVFALKLVALALWLFVPEYHLWSALLFFIGEPWMLWNVFAPGASGIVPVFTRFETDRPEVWLTIDDGPDAQDTPRLLDALDRHEAHATFFLVGERAARHPELVAEIIRRGHEIGHHTHTHPECSFWCALPTRIGRELDEPLAVFARSSVRPRFFRAPVGIKNPLLARALAERGLACVAWNVRSHDSFARNPDEILKRMRPQLRPGAILLMHEGPRLHASVRVTAVERVLEQLSALGLRCVIPTNAQLR